MTVMTARSRTIFTAIHRLTSFLLTFALTFGANCRFQALAGFEPAARKQPAMESGGSVYYVSTTGQDTNPGTAESPFKTFAKAVSVLAAGDTLHVLPGTYHETLKLTVPGTADGPINIIGNRAILDLQESESFGIRVSGSY